MRKVIWWMFVSLDGYVSGPDGELDWMPEGDESQDIDQYSYEALEAMDTALLGGKTYELFVSFWPTEASREEIIADKINAMQKVVFSRTLDAAPWGEWDTARLAQGEPAAEIKRLKREPGKDLVIFGSTSLAQSLMRLGLIDEYRLFVVPIVLGGGRPLFEDVGDRLKLELMGSRVFRSGVVLLCYRPAP